MIAIFIKNMALFLKLIALPMIVNKEIHLTEKRRWFPSLYVKNSIKDFSWLERQEKYLIGLKPPFQAGDTYFRKTTEDQNMKTGRTKIGYTLFGILSLEPLELYLVS